MRWRKAPLPRLLTDAACGPRPGCRLPRTGDLSWKAFFFSSTRFAPSAEELDEEHEDYINPGHFAKELADFLAEGLLGQGYKVGFRCAEDWGQWLELAHDGGYTLAVGCANMSEFENGAADHRVFIEPSKPFVRKLLRKIDVRDDVEKLAAAVKAILTAESEISDLEVGASD